MSGPRNVQHPQLTKWMQHYIEDVRTNTTQINGKKPTSQSRKTQTERKTGKTALSSYHQLGIYTVSLFFEQDHWRAVVMSLQALSREPRWRKRRGRKGLRHWSRESRNMAQIRENTLAIWRKACDASQVIRKESQMRFLGKILSMTIRVGKQRLFT